jgi:hypothetical protein
MVAGVVAFAAAPSGAAPAWSVSPTPSPAGPQFGGLASVDCPNPTTCFAVGSTADVLQAQRWNGSRWSVLPIPTPPNGLSVALSGIDCPSPKRCFAVGWQQREALGFARSELIQHWNGTRWSIMSNPGWALPESPLSAVSCPATNRCFAVGERSAGKDRTFVEHWNGTRWSVRSSPSPSASATLRGVSCASASNCIAVGSTGKNEKSTPWAIRWDGSRWSVLKSPPLNGQDGTFGDVACPSANRCIAVGASWRNDSDPKTLVEEWNGKSWSKVASPNPSGSFSKELFDISCSGPSSCMAVGRRVVERWNGKRWVILAYPAAAGFADAVSCPGAATCVVVGLTFAGTSSARWNGKTWKVAPPPSGASQSSLDQVSCATATQCLAIGEYFTGSAKRSLAEQWNGATWGYVAAPTRPAGAVTVRWHDLACPSATDCIAVGSYSTNSRSSELAQRWNGGGWTTLALAQPVDSGSFSIGGLSCISATSYYAVGRHSPVGGGPQTLVEHWNGSAWSIIPSPNPPGATASWFNDVSCSSETSCVAVGGSAGATLVEHWNGTSWSIVPSPNAGSGSSALTAVSCVSASSCIAVGENSVTGSFETPFAQLWDGSSWSMIADPTTGGPGGSLASLSCFSATSCFGVGIAYFAVDDQPGFFAPQAYAQQWNGTSWSEVTLPKPPKTRFAFTNDLTCAGGSCLIAGSYMTPTSEYTLVERFA